MKSDPLTNQLIVIKAELAIARNCLHDAAVAAAHGDFEQARQLISNSKRSHETIAGLIRCLKINAPDVMGYSVGGEVALRMAIQHSELVRKLVIVSATYRRGGWYPEILEGESRLDAQAAAQMKQTPIYESYEHIAPRPQDWPTLCTKMGNMFRQDYDWSAEVAKIKLPVLLAFGDADAVRTSNAVQFFELLGGGRQDAGWDGSGMSNTRLAILPGTTHYTIFSSPQLTSCPLRPAEPKGLRTSRSDVVRFDASSAESVRQQINDGPRLHGLAKSNP